MNANTVNVDNMRAWIEALESGVYPQTSSRLRDDDGYCCLGVLCDIQGVRWHDFGFFEGTVGPFTHLPSPAKMGWLGPAESMVNASLLLSEQIDRFGTALRDDVIANPTRLVNVSALNDCGFSFVEIADLLRRTYGIARPAPRNTEPTATTEGQSTSTFAKAAKTGAVSESVTKMTREGEYL